MSNIERFKTIVEELQNMFVAAEDMINLQLRAKIQVFEEDIQKTRNVKDIWGISEIESLKKHISAIK